MNHFSNSLSLSLHPAFRWARSFKFSVQRGEKRNHFYNENCNLRWQGKSARVKIRNKRGGNKTSNNGNRRHFELENLFTVGEDENSQERKQTLGSKHVENLIKFLFMEINIFSCLIIFPCLWLLRAARTPGEKREKVDIQLSRRGRGRNKFSLQHAAALMRNYYWNVKCRWRNICAD